MHQRFRLKLKGARLRAAAKRGASYVGGGVPFGYRGLGSTTLSGRKHALNGFCCSFD